MAAKAGDPHAGGAQRKSQRAAIFAQWLLDTFGRDLLNRGSGLPLLYADPFESIACNHEAQPQA